jgi:hypothetical protein
LSFVIPRKRESIINFVRCLLPGVTGLPGQAGQS